MLVKLCIQGSLTKKVAIISENFRKIISKQKHHCNNLRRPLRIMPLFNDLFFRLLFPSSRVFASTEPVYYLHRPLLVIIDQAGFNGWPISAPVTKRFFIFLFRLWRFRFGSSHKDHKTSLKPDDTRAHDRGYRQTGYIGTNRRTMTETQTSLGTQLDAIRHKKREYLREKQPNQKPDSTKQSNETDAQGDLADAAVISADVVPRKKSIAKVLKPSSAFFHHQH